MKFYNSENLIQLLSTTLS